MSSQRSVEEERKHAGGCDGALTKNPKKNKRRATLIKQPADKDAGRAESSN